MRHLAHLPGPPIAQRPRPNHQKLLAKLPKALLWPRLKRTCHLLSVLKMPEKTTMPTRMNTNMTTMTTTILMTRLLGLRTTTTKMLPKEFFSEDVWDSHALEVALR